MLEDAAAPSYGAAAVDKAAEEGEMRWAEAPQSLPTIDAMSPDGTEVIKHAGSKTFVLRDGVWVDTTFDPTTMEPVQVGFLTDDYFDLVAAVPLLGDYFALGQQVTAVHDGTAYKVVDGEGEAVVIPVVTPAATAEGQAGNEAADPTRAPTTQGTDEETATPAATQETQEPGGLCLGAIIVPGMLLGLVGAFTLGEGRGITRRNR